MIRVKICGITNVEDALHAADCGADAIGFIFAESSRRISMQKAVEIRAELAPFVQAVGVFVRPDPRQAGEVFGEVGLDFIQLFGGDEDDFLRESGISARRLIRTIPVGSKVDLEEVGKTSAAIVHLDTKFGGKAGGTGKTFDWGLAAAASAYGKPIMLSGGLNPDNVVKAIEIGMPQAVDVSSGVESSPGRKDPDKVHEFIRRVKGHAT